MDVLWILPCLLLFVVIDVLDSWWGFLTSTGHQGQDQESLTYVCLHINTREILVAHLLLDKFRLFTALWFASGWTAGLHRQGSSHPDTILPTFKLISLLCLLEVPLSHDTAQFQEAENLDRCSVPVFIPKADITSVVGCSYISSLLWNLSSYYKEIPPPLLLLWVSATHQWEDQSWCILLPRWCPSPLPLDSDCLCDQGLSCLWKSSHFHTWTFFTLSSLPPPLLTYFGTFLIAIVSLLSTSANSAGQLSNHSSEINMLPQSLMRWTSISCHFYSMTRIELLAWWLCMWLLWQTICRMGSASNRIHIWLS